jgi:hypothetical protein
VAYEPFDYSTQQAAPPHPDWRGNGGMIPQQPGYWPPPVAKPQGHPVLKILGLAALGLIIWGGIQLAPDIRRYIKIKSM